MNDVWLNHRHGAPCRMFDAIADLGEGDPSVRPEVEAGELEAPHCELVTWQVVAFGICLELGGAWRHGNGRRLLLRENGLAVTEGEKQTYGQTERDQEEKASARHGANVCQQRPNGSRLSCGRNARWRKAAERQIERLAGEATQFFPPERPAASSAC